MSAGAGGARPAGGPGGGHGPGGGGGPMGGLFVQSQKSTDFRGTVLRLAGWLRPPWARITFVIGMSEQDYEDMFEMRKIYEIQAVKWAIERITEEEMDRLEETFEFMEFYTLRKDIDKMLTINTGFHQVIYEASHNRMLRKLLSSYQSFLKYKGAEAVYEDDYLQTVLEEHRDIFKAFKDKDVKAGALAMENHIDRAKERRCGL